MRGEGNERSKRKKKKEKGIWTRRGKEKKEGKKERK